MPPAALIFTPGPMCLAKRATSSRVAPPVEKPVEVLIYSAPEAVTSSHILIFSASVSRQVSTMTFRIRPWQLSLMALISSSRASHFWSFTQPMLMTISISSAPLRMASSVSKTLTAVVE